MSTLIIIDFYNYLYRAYYAIRPLSSATGQPVNAVYGFLKMVQRLREKFPAAALVVATEGGQGHRHALFADYKIHRQSMPEELRSQVPILLDLLTAVGIPLYKNPGYEADDVIASLALQYSGPVLIASGDKDLLQLVDERVQVFDSMKEIIYGVKEVTEKFGLPPKLILDYLSLVGDSSDNIPGAAGIGPKGAVKLLMEYGDLNGVLSAKLPEKLQAKIEGSRANIILSKQLAALVGDLEVELPPPTLTRSPDLDNKLQALNMKSLLGKL